MSYEFTRLEMLIGEVGIEKLSSSTLVVFGIGGVGSYAVEALARSAIGNLILVDFDMISESNINRQIHSLEATVGKNKVDVMKERIESINSNCNVTAVQKIINEENIEEFFRDKKIDFVLDAIDMMRAKISLIEYCYENNLNIISSMGFGNKMNPEMIEIAVGKHFRENKESKHWRNAMYGWYRYDSRFAIPVYRDDEEVERYNIFHASLIVRYSEDGKLYLYDVIDIKKRNEQPD